MKHNLELTPADEIHYEHLDRDGWITEIINGDEYQRRIQHMQFTGYVGSAVGSVKAYLLPTVWDENGCCTRGHILVNPFADMPPLPDVTWIGGAIE